jgi:hypothetical protein
MKKIVAFSVLLVLLSAAVFADDDSGWKIGFSAALTRDFFYSTKATGGYEHVITTNPADPLGDGTFTGKLGEYIKGSSNMWTMTGLPTPDQRLIVSLSNNGDHHSVYIDAKVDKTWIAAGPSLMGVINGSNADWWFSGDTGASGAAVVFDGKVGTGRYGGFVPAYEFWNDWIDSGNFNFFGVQVMEPNDEGATFQQSNNLSTVDMDQKPWRSLYAIGTSFGNFRFAIGSTFGWGAGIDAGGVDNPVASASKVKGGFMFSGKNLGPLAFDLFYGINGGDNNTALRGTGKWENLLGAYVGLNIVEKLGLSVGYTARFTKYEKDHANIETDPTKKPDYVAFDIQTPTWSGVDIKVKYSGISKMDITFNNNISFAAVAGAERKKPSDTLVLGLDGTALLLGGDPGTITGKINTNTQNWFAYTAVLGVGFSLTDNLSVTLGILDQLTVFSTELDETALTSVSSNAKSKATNNELRTALTAQYGAGNVTFGLGIQLFVTTVSVETESKTTSPGYSYEETFKGSLNVVKFGIPIFFKVSI